MTMNEMFAFEHKALDEISDALHNLLAVAQIDYDRFENHLTVIQGQLDQLAEWGERLKNNYDA